MTGGEVPGHKDYLINEVNESNTQDSSKDTISKLLRKTAELCEKTDPETAAAIRKDSEDVRLSTINSLLCEREETQRCLAEIKAEVDLSQEQKNNLSDGKITDSEVSKIQTEFNELEANERDIQIERFSNLIEEKELGYKYELIIPIFFGIDIGSKFIQDMQKEIEDTGKISYASLKELNALSLGKFNINDSIQNEMNEKIEAGFKKGDILKEVKNIGEKEGEELYNYNVALRIGLSNFLEKNPQYLEEFLFVYMDTLFPPVGCDLETSLMISTLRAQYLENKSIDIQDNLGSYYKNQGITQERLKGKSEELRELGELLKQGDCTLDALGKIQEFNEIHFPEIDFSTTKEDSLRIIGSVLEYKDADIQVQKSEANRVEDEGERNGLFAELSDDERDVAIQEGNLQTMSEVSEEDFQIFLKFGEYFGKKINTEDAKVLAYILEKPKERLQEIQDPNQLQSIFKTYTREKFYTLPNEIQNSETGRNFRRIMESLAVLQLSDISPSSISAETLRSFPGKFNRYENVPISIFQHNPDLIKNILGKSGNNSLLYSLSKQAGGTNLILDTLSSDTKILDRSGRDISDIIYNRIPLAVLEADTKNLLPISEEERTHVNHIDTPEIFSLWIDNILNKDISGTSLRVYGPMNRYLEKNGIENPSVKENVLRLIEAGYGSKIDGINFNTNTLDIAVLLLQQDPTRIHDIPVNLRGDKSIVTTLLNHGEAYYEYIEIINLDTALTIVQALREKGLPITGKMRIKLGIIFANISNTQKREFLNNKEKRHLLSDVFKSLEEYDANIDTTRKISAALEEKSEHSGNIQKYLEDIPELTGTDKIKEFIQTLESGGGELSYQDAYMILESEGLSSEEIGEHLHNILAITRRKIETEQIEILSQSFQDIPEEARELFMTSENNETIIDSQALTQAFEKFLLEGENNQLDKASLLLAFTEKYNLGGEDAVKIQKYLSNEAELPGIDFLLTKSPQELSTIAQSGELDDYIQAYEKSYFTGEYPEDIFEEIQKTRKQEDTAKSLGDEYHTDRDITAILEQGVFTPKEISDLTPEEVGILTGDSEDARENLINMYETLKELNLEFIWRYRYQYLIAMGDATIENDTEGSIDPSEFLKILNYTLSLLGEKSDFTNIDSSINTLKTLNDAHNNPNKKNNFGRSDIEQIFWDKGYLDEYIGLNISVIRQDTSSTHK